MSFSFWGLEYKSRSQETPGVTGKFGLGVWNEAGQRLIDFCQENALVIANTLFQQHKRRLYSTHGHHQMVNTEIRLIIFFAAKDGEALYSQHKQDWELTVAQMVKKPPAMQETNLWVQSLGWEDPLEKETATHSSILAWRFPWTEEPCRLQSMELQRIGHN